MKQRPPPPCLACTRRSWRSVDGFMVLGCRARGLRFGIGPDLARGNVNKAGGCVAMPQACGAHEGTQAHLPPSRGKAGMGVQAMENMGARIPPPP